MLTILMTNWWALAIRGIVAITFGVFAFLWPGLTLAALIWFFGIYALADGILAICTSISEHDRATRWWTLLFQGGLGIVAGLLALSWPGITALFLLRLIALWAIFSGAFQIVAAIRLRRELTGEWLPALNGIAPVGFGVLLLLFPGAGALAIVWWIGAYAFVSGALLLALALMLRKLNKELSAEPRTA